MKYEHIGERIKELRSTKNITQDKLADLSKIDVRYIRMLENGERPNPTIDTLKKIASALEISISDLL